MPSGTVVYTERAFEQDASQAMRGDIVRGLIELITNADDAYDTASGSIRVSICRPSQADPDTYVSVSDHARGLDAQSLIRCFTTLGGRSSGFEAGARVRGNLGRGAKDTAAFGSVRFEAIRDGKYSCLDLHNTGRWNMLEEDRDREATLDDYQRLSIEPGANGLTATIRVKDRARVPKYTNLFESLSKTCQLRLLTADRPVVLAEKLQSTVTERTVSYESPATELVLEDDFPVPGYPGVTAHLSIEKMAVRGEGAPRPDSDHGLLIVGSRAVYENTLFSLGERPQAGWFRGTLRCEHIDTLIREYDDRAAGGENHPEANPTRLLSRDRDGLIAEHPFTEALAALVLRKLGPLVQAEEQDAGRTGREGSGLRDSLQDLSEALIQQLQADLDELEEDDRGDGSGRTGTKALTLIPPVVVMRPSAEKTLTIVARNDDVDIEHDEILAVSSDDDVCAVSDERSPFLPHARLEDSSVSQIRVSATRVGTAEVRVTIGSQFATCRITVTDAARPHPDPPTELQFAHQQASATPGRPRTVELWAPIDLLRNADGPATIRVDGDAVRLEVDSVELSLDGVLGWFTAKVPLVGEIVGERAVITATLNGQEASTTINVVAPDDPTALGLDIQVVDEAAITQRASIEMGSNGITLTVYGRHKALGPLLGGHSEHGFEHEGERHVRLVLAEIIAGELSEWILQKEAGKYPERFQDADSVFAARKKHLSRYLPRIQGTLLSSSG